MNFADCFREYINGVKGCLDEIEEEALGTVVGAIMKAYHDGKHIFIMGNGGSAATASHFACDLSKTASVDGKPRLKAISFTDNAPLMTAISNDISYASVFKEQLVNFLDPGDLVICISASGNSPNVLEAAKFARAKGAQVIGFVGCDGGKLKGLSDISICFCCRDYGQLEDVHLVLAHLITKEVGRRIKEQV